MSENEVRKLAAIMFTDMVGYSALSQRDDKLALELLEEHRELLREIFLRFNGSEIKTIGDAFLVEFTSALEAAQCAIEIQRALAKRNHDVTLDRRIEVKIGIHIGDVVHRGGDVYGDGVNIASRIEPMAGAGGICVSMDVERQTRNSLEARFEKLAPTELKNISVAMDLFRIVLPWEHRSKAETTSKNAATALTGKWKLWVGLLLLLSAALFAILFFHRAGPHAIHSVAVLPLDNYSGDPGQDYFAEGMTDELTTDLATISRLRVISRSSTTQFTGGHRPSTPEIARMLDVDAVVEGSVRHSGDKVRVTAQLIDARADRHLWAKSFERDSRDVLALQSELASAIASEINVELTPSEQARLTSARQVNPEAYDAYLKGRYFFNRPSDENLSKAITNFEEAIRLDPNFAPAYSGLSDAYLWAAFNEGVVSAKETKSKTKAAAEKALALDPASAEAHTSLANYKSWYEHDWSGADKLFREAISLNPNYAFAHDQWGLSLGCEGRFDESISEGKRAVALDPLDPAIAVDNTLSLTGQRSFQKAREEAQRGAELDPTFFFPQMQFGWIDIQAGNFKAALPALKKAAAMESPPFATAWLGYAYGAVGDREAALATIEELKKKSLHGEVAPFNLALIHLGLGERERALDLLEQAAAADSQWMMYLKVDRVFDPLRSDPRFVALMKKCHFEEDAPVQK